jgi:hypothetical protein
MAYWSVVVAVFGKVPSVCGLGAVGAAEWVGRAVVAGRVVAHVLGVLTPRQRQCVRVTALERVELIADRLHRGRVDTAAAVNLTRIFYR